MKVLFLQNLEHHKVGDIKNIPDGYARNFLLPKGIAVVATDDKVAELENKMEKIKKDEEKIISKLKALAEKIESKEYKIAAQAGDEDKLFGSVTNRDISEALATAKLNVDKHNIEIINPIHELGHHEATAKLGHGIHATIKVEVVRA
jgi:large subunit ribosomal protein L9